MAPDGFTEVSCFEGVQATSSEALANGFFGGSIEIGGYAPDGTEDVDVDVITTLL